MRFEELTKEQQEGRIHCIESMFIDEYADREKRQNIIYPTFEEYVDFFNDFYEDFEVVGDEIRCIKENENQIIEIEFDENNKACLFIGYRK